MKTNSVFKTFKKKLHELEVELRIWKNYPDVYAQVEQEIKEHCEAYKILFMTEKYKCTECPAEYDFDPTECEC